jgi:hypothetical protein
MGTLDPQPTPEVSIGTLDIVNETPVPLPLPRPVVQERAGVATFALPTIPKQDIQANYENGNEQFVKSTAAAQADEAKRQNFINLLTHFSQIKKGPLTTDEQATILAEMEKSQEPTNPNSVVEEAYGKRFLDALVKDAKPGSWFSETIEKFPQETKEIIEQGQRQISLDAYIRSRMQELKAKVDEEGWVGTASNFAKNFITLGMYDEYNRRGNVKGSSFMFGVGNAVEQQRQLLYTMPTQAAIAEIDRIVEQMTDPNSLLGGNPHLALEFLNNMVNMSSSDIVAENLGTAVTFGTLPLGGLIKGIAKSVKNVPAEVQAVKNAVDTAVNANKTTRNSISSEFPSFDRETLPSPSWADIAASEAAGDIPRAAKIKASDNIVKSMSGVDNPINESMESLPQIFRTGADNVVKGVDSTELTNRIKEQYLTLGTKLFDTLNDMIRVNRTPAIEEVIDQVIKHTADKYPGLNNNFVGFDGLWKNNITNTLYVEFKLGQNGAKLFDSEEAAKVWALHNKIPVTGFADAPRQYQLMRLIHEANQAIKFLDDAEQMVLAGKYEGGLKFWEDSGDKALMQSINLSPEDIFNEKKSITAGIDKMTKELDALRAKPGARIQPQGTKFYISHYVPVDENMPIVRNNLFTTVDSQTDASRFAKLKQFTSWLTGAQHSFSKDARTNAIITQYSASLLEDLAYAELADVRKLERFAAVNLKKKQVLREWNEVIEFGRTAIDPETGKQGYLFRSIGELNDHYITYYNRKPSDGEVSAYFAMQRYNDLSRVLEDINIYKNKSIQGGQEHNIRVLGRQKGQVFSSPNFEGSIQTTLPGDDEIVGVFGINLGGADGVHSSNKLPKWVTQGVAEGKLQVVRLLPGEADKYPFKGLGNTPRSQERITYIITDSLESRPLNFKQVSDRNVIWEHNHPFAIKQANVSYSNVLKKNIYLDDNYVMPAQIHALGAKVAEHLDGVRIALKAGDEVAARTVAKNLPMNWEDIKSWFEPTVDALGNVTPAKLNLDESIVLTERNIKVIEKDNALVSKYSKLNERGQRISTIKDVTKQLHVGELDRVGNNLQVVTDKGTAGKPLYNLEPASYLSPIESMNRGLRNIINSTLMDDYKNFSINHWVEKYKDYLKAKPEELLHAPAYYFYKGEFREGTPKNILSEAESNNWKIRSLTGIPNKLSSHLHYVAQEMADSVYGKFGPKATKLEPSWAIPKIKDAASAVRTLTYHAVLGLFTPTTLVTNHMTFVSMAAIDGLDRAAAGTFAAMVHRYTMKNPGTLQHLDKVLSKINIGVGSYWKPGEFAEAFQLMLKTGFHRVNSRTNAFLDTGEEAKLVKNAGHTFLDFANVFMRWSEENVRHGAWYIAYRRFRDKNPTAKIGEKELRSILERADMLSGSMTEASKSNLQKGPLAIPTQFLGYSLRFMEEMTGSRLTWEKKARLFGTYFGLFGVSAFGMFGFPFDQVIREKAIEAGYSRGENLSSTMLTEGAISTMIAHLTGGTDKGQYLNIGQKGAPGLEAVRDFFSTDANVWDLTMGASGSVLANMASSTDSLRYAIFSTLTTKDSESTFKVQPSHMTDMMKAISSGFNINRGYHALTTGEWLTRKGQLIDKDISWFNTIARSATGLQPQDVPDMARFHKLSQERGERLKKAEQLYLKEMRKMFQAINANNDTQADQYGANARAILNIEGYPPEMRAQLGRRAAQENLSIVDRTKLNYYMRKVPLQDRERLRDAFSTQRELKQ